ncbi:hypothetical protein F1880_008399 [Penicillium rolfsii]|nr:hypothetical protein F1880_008399 [Penicillium rolfsii]
MMLTPDNLPYPIEEKTWGKSVDTLDEMNQTEGILNGHIICVLRTNNFRDEFDGWTLDIFKVASKSALKMLRLHLTTHGEWIRTGIGMSFAKGLYDCLQEVTQHEWTKDDIEAHLKEHPDNFNSRWNPSRDQTPTIRPSSLATRSTSVNPPTPHTPQEDVVKPHIGQID